MFILLQNAASSNRIDCEKLQCNCIQSVNSTLRTVDFIYHVFHYLSSNICFSIFFSKVDLRILNCTYNMLKLKTYVWTPSSVLYIHSPSVLRIHSPSVRGQCLSSVRGQFQKWTNWLKALSELSIAFLPPGVRVNGVSCLDNCPEVRSVAFNVPAKRDILTDRQTIRRASEHLALLKTMQSSHPEITVSLK